MRHCIYDSNAQELQRGASSALEGNPEATFGWKHPIGSLPFTIGVQLAANADRYANVAQADGDEATAKVRLQYYDRSDDQALAPFVWYQGALMFDATFSPWTETEQDVAIGLEKTFNFTGGFHALPRSAQSAEHAVWNIGTELSVQRRWRTPGPDSTALVAKLGVNWMPVAAWTVSVSAEAKRRWYEALMLANRPVARRDFMIEPIMTLLWDSGVASFGSPQLAVQVAFDRQSSNAPGRSFSGWSIGPILTVAWRF